MKRSLEELKVIKEKILQKNSKQAKNESFKIVVGMATCSIASGSRPVLNELIKQIEEHELNNILISHAGCVGNCVYEPIVEVIDSSMERTTYVKMTSEKIDRVIEEHIIGGQIVSDFLKCDNMHDDFSL